MAKKTTEKLLAKDRLHPRNKHRVPYDFNDLAKASPILEAFLFINKHGNQSLDFADPEAVKALNSALLKRFYGVENWELPPDYLCPPVPGRADYIHYAADLLAAANDGVIPRGKKIRMLDIGVGANCIYPLIAHSEYGWSCVGSDSAAASADNARQIVEANKNFEKAIEIRLQKDPASFFNNIVAETEVFDLVVCNPPFHSSREQSRLERKRKWKNLGMSGKEEDHKNFGGHFNELHTPGGEKAFIGKMIAESAAFATQCLWFSSLVSRKDHLAAINRKLEKVKPEQIQVIEMGQGQKTSRILAWTFMNEQQLKKWAALRWTDKS